MSAHDRWTGRSAVSSYLADVRKRRPLNKEQERQLFHAIDRGDPRAFDELVESNLGFVVKIAGEYRGLGLPFEDMLNEGNLGLIEAARRFEPQRGVKFITYAIWWIRKSILQAISEKSRVVRVPYAQQRKLEKIRRAEGQLRSRLGREPARRDLASELDLSEREVERALQVRTKPTNLVRTAQDEGTIEIVELLRAVGRSQEQRVIDREALAILVGAFAELTEQQRTVITLRFGLDGEPPLTLQAVGERMSLSRERIRQIEMQAFGIMRRRIRRPPTRPKLVCG